MYIDATEQRQKCLIYKWVIKIIDNCLFPCGNSSSHNHCSSGWILRTYDSNTVADLYFVAELSYYIIKSFIENKTNQFNEMMKYVVFQTFVICYWNIMLQLIFRSFLLLIIFNIQLFLSPVGLVKYVWSQVFGFGRMDRFARLSIYIAIYVSRLK